MNNALMSEIAIFLSRSNVRLSFPEIREWEMAQDGTSKASLKFSVRMSENEIAPSGILLPLIIHTAFDVLVDYLYPQLEGETFRQRTIKLPCATDIQKVFKGAYRLMRVIRNGLVHSRNASDHTGVKYKLHYETIDRKTQYKVECTDRALVNLRTIAVILLKNPDINDKYLECTLVSLYQKMLAGVSDFSDDLNGPLEPVDVGVGFKLGVRYRVLVNVSDEDEQSGSFPVNRVPIDEQESAWAHDEFLCRYKDNIYLIPGEQLGADSVVNILMMKSWIVSPGNALVKG